MDAPQETPRPLTYKIVAAGASGAGKTSFVRRHSCGEFAETYTPTIGYRVRSLAFSTSQGPILFKIWDLAGAPEYAGLDYETKKWCYEGAQGFLVFFDLTDTDSRLYADMILDNHSKGKHTKGAATVLCGSKADLARAGTRVEDVRPGVPFYEVSARNCRNYEKPFLSLARQLTGDPALVFSGSLARALPGAPTVPFLLAAWSQRRTAEFRARDREFTYPPSDSPGPSVSLYDDVYDGPLRGDLEELVYEAERAGYRATVYVRVTFS